MPAIFTHKKFQAGIVMTLAIFLGQFIPAWYQTGSVVGGLAAVNWIEVSAPILTAIGAQGVADFGKEKAKIEAPPKSYYPPPGKERGPND